MNTLTKQRTINSKKEGSSELLFHYRERHPFIYGFLAVLSFGSSVDALKRFRIMSDEEAFEDDWNSVWKRH